MTLQTKKDLQELTQVFTDKLIEIIETEIKEESSEEIPQGTECYFWDGDKPERPYKAPYHRREDARHISMTWEHREGYMKQSDYAFDHAEPVEKEEKFEIDAWVTVDADSKVYIFFHEQPTYVDRGWGVDSSAPSYSEYVRVRAPLTKKIIELLGTGEKAIRQIRI